MYNITCIINYTYHTYHIIYILCVCTHYISYHIISYQSYHIRKDLERIRRNRSWRVAKAASEPAVVSSDPSKVHSPSGGKLLLLSGLLYLERIRKTWEGAFGNLEHSDAFRPFHPFCCCRSCLSTIWCICLCLTHGCSSAPNIHELVLKTPLIFQNLAGMHSTHQINIQIPMYINVLHGHLSHVFFICSRHVVNVWTHMNAACAMKDMKAAC